MNLRVMRRWVAKEDVIIFLMQNNVRWVVKNSILSQGMFVCLFDLEFLYPYKLLDMNLRVMRRWVAKEDVIIFLLQTNVRWVVKNSILSQGVFVCLIWSSCNTYMNLSVMRRWVKSVHFKKTVAQSSFLSKVLSILLKSKQIQQKWQCFLKEMRIA